MCLLRHYRDMARNNAWSNDRLLSACALLSQAALDAPRTSFFPSLMQTLNHILRVDRFYISGLDGRGHSWDRLFGLPPRATLAPLAREQREWDLRLVAFTDALDAAGLAAGVGLDRGARGIVTDTASDILAHLFVHQVHHRGQVHAMLAGTEVKPPQLDEYFLAGDAAAIAPELAALGLRRA